MEPVKLFGIIDCKRTLAYRSWLDAHRVPYLYYDIGESEENQYLLSRYHENGGLHFPTLVVKDQGLKRPKIRDLMNVLIRNFLHSLPDGTSYARVGQSACLITKKSLGDTRQLEFGVQRIPDREDIVPKMEILHKSFPMDLPLVTQNRILEVLTTFSSGMQGIA